jgi:endonuclease YncB( thermonuclease family)
VCAQGQRPLWPGAGENLNDRIVREGWALDFRRYTSAYLEAEEEAKRRRVGLWRGDFERHGSGGKSIDEGLE